MTNRLIPMLVLATGMFAQVPGSPPQLRTDDVKAYFSLTDAQIQALQQLRQTEMQSLRTLHDQAAQKQQALQQQLQAGSTDAAALGRMLLDIQAIRKQIDLAATGFHTQAIALLNATQKTQLATLEAAAKGGTIPEAAALGLLTPPANGPGPGGPRGPRGFDPAAFRAPRGVN